MMKVVAILLVLFGLSIGQEEEITIFLVSDSTVADKPYGDGNPEKGWGQVFPLYLKEGIRVENHAVNGRSTKSFIDEGRWDKILERLKPGDYVFIEFGHNDQKSNDSTRYTDPENAYRANLERFISETKEKGGNPVLLTPIVRRRFDDNGKFFDTHGKYPDVVRAVAFKKEVPLIDLHESSTVLLETWGEDRSKQLFLHIEPGEYTALPEGREDDTHLSAVGAFRICDLVVAAMKDELPELNEYIKE